MPKDNFERFRISQCAEELALAILFIIDKGLKDEYVDWSRKMREYLKERNKHG